MIYFLKANDKVKIGYADDPLKRIPAIQISSPYRLAVLLIEVLGYKFEYRFVPKGKREET